jgi:hypothetical protein
MFVFFSADFFLRKDLTYFDEIILFNVHVKPRQTYSVLVVNGPVARGSSCAANLFVCLCVNNRVRF